MNIKIFIWPVLVVVYISLLSFNLLTLPLYLDEGLYVFWSYLFSIDPAFAYVSLQDGKTPLFMWLTVFLNSYINNFFFTGRFISVLSSVITLICWLLIGYKILDKKPIFLFVLFLITPFNILISRLAFVDALLVTLSSISILGIFFAKESADKNRVFKVLLFSVLAGISLGLAFMAKTTARIFLVSEIAILIFWIIIFLKDRKFKPAILLSISPFILTILYYEILSYIRFGGYRFWDMIASKESILIFTLPEIYNVFFVTHNFQTYLKNLSLTYEYFFTYFNSVILFFLIGVYWILKNRKHFWVLLLTSILTIGVFLSAKIPASRYFAIIIPSFLLVSSIGLFWLWQKSKFYKIICIFLILIPTYSSARLIFTPLNAFYSSDDQGNFLDYNLNAPGLNETVEYLSPKKENSAIAVTGIWGVAEGALVVFKDKGFETYSTNKVVTGLTKKDDPCEEGFKELEDKCWKIDFGDITKSQKSEKYIYFMSEHIDIETLKKLINIEVVKEFIRPKTNLKVYLLRSK